MEKDISSLLDVQGACNNIPSWKDGEGDTCKWYEQNGWCNGAPTKPIADYREYENADGIGAHQACCECAGGDYKHNAGAAASLKHAKKDCWDECGHKDGYCDFCGSGVCCRSGWSSTNGCTVSHGQSNRIMGNRHMCVALEKTCLALANVDHHDLVKAAKLVEAVYGKDRFKTEVHAQGLKTAFYLMDGKYDLDFGIADPMPHPNPGARDPWVVFAGSESTEDWKQNFNALYTTVPYETSVSGVEVHKGFANQWSTARDEVQRKFKQLQNAGVTRAYFAGHSLGGAVATVAAAEMQALFPGVKIELVTFGAPACGNAAFGENINELMGSRITRVVQSGDPVPCLTQLVGVADNIAGELVFNEGSKQWSSPREEHCNRDLTDGGASIDDHLMLPTYIPLVKACT